MIKLCNKMDMKRESQIGLLRNVNNGLKKSLSLSEYDDNIHISSLNNGLVNGETKLLL
jgi:hypothetical protein